MPSERIYSNFAINLVAMATPLEESKKGTDRSHSRKYLSFGEKNVKIGAVDSEIIWLH